MQIIGFFPVLKWFSLNWADIDLEIQGTGEKYRINSWAHRLLLRKLP